MAQMIRVVITIGFNDKDVKFQLYPDRFYYEKIDELLKLNTIEAATLAKCEGYYKGQKENSMQIVLLLNMIDERYQTISDEDIKNIRSFVMGIKDELNQECVMVEHERVTCNFI